MDDKAKDGEEDEGKDPQDEEEKDQKDKAPEVGHEEGSAHDGHVGDKDKECEKDGGKDQDGHQEGSAQEGHEDDKNKEDAKDENMDPGEEQDSDHEGQGGDQGNKEDKDQEEEDKKEEQEEDKEQGDQELQQDLPPKAKLGGKRKLAKQEATEGPAKRARGGEARLELTRNWRARGRASKCASKDTWELAHSFLQMQGAPGPLREEVHEAMQEFFKVKAFKSIMANTKEDMIRLALEKPLDPLAMEALTRFHAWSNFQVMLGDENLRRCQWGLSFKAGQMGLDPQAPSLQVHKPSWLPEAMATEVSRLCGKMRTLRNGDQREEMKERINHLKANLAQAKNLDFPDTLLDVIGTPDYENWERKVEAITLAANEGAKDLQCMQPHCTSLAMQPHCTSLALQPHCTSLAMQPDCTGAEHQVPEVHGRPQE